ncbi:MAG: DNA recombination protein RmuC [archaeon]
MWEWLIGLVSFILGLAIGYYFATARAYQSADLSTKSTLLQSLTTQVTEMKGQFDKYEQLRLQKEKAFEEYQSHRDKLYQQFVDSTKEFYIKQNEMRKETEDKREKQLSKFASVIDSFQRTIHGTKTRGMVGEELLRSYLSEAIKSRLVRSPLRTEKGEVEFAWNLGDGKHIPIDAKLPKLPDLVNSMTEETTQAEKTHAKREVLNNIKHKIQEVKAYINQPNTINKAILAIPEGAIELAPEVIDLGASQNVFVCAYNQVFFIGTILSEEYAHMKEQGEVGELKTTQKKLIDLLKAIFSCTDTIDRQARSVIKFNEDIRDKVHQGLRFS